MAAYRVRALDPEGTNDMEDRIYRVESLLPCNWIGDFTAVTQTQLNHKSKTHAVNLERTFIMNEDEIIKYFNKFYVAPKELSDTA